MARKIGSKIVAYRVVPPESAPAPIQMHETVIRPERLTGTTYKLKTPQHVCEHSLFITINDMVLNEGSEHEIRCPFEIFINTKSLEHHQWIVALTRIISAVFRKGGDVTFLVEELRSVFDPKGGYWDHGRYVPSLIAGIGNVIETHLIEIGMLASPETDSAQKAYLAEKYDAATGFPPSASLCPKCHYQALVLQDGCMTCLNCGDSKCG
ncbi:TSCPD domain-containing protein [Aeromonas diversa]|uniref:TSCPD domain-containing protein n=1 Tax=Aeromonas diversa TaxID=502790 RepID=UPI003462558E